MKKQELIHLHGLLAEVSNQCAEWDNCEIDLGEYEAKGFDRHRSTNRKQIIKPPFCACWGITMNMREGEQEEAVAATAD